MPRPAMTVRSAATTMLLAAALAPAAGAQKAVSTNAIPGANGAANAGAVKQPDPPDLAFWKNIRFTTLSNDGKWFAYQLTPNEGDAEVIVRPTANGEERRFAIGEPPAPTGGFFGGGN